MATFRDSILVPIANAGRTSELRDRGGASGKVGPARPPAGERLIGEIISDSRRLSPSRVSKILARQIEKGERFGEAAIALGYASADDVLTALALQFHYPVATAQQRKKLPELAALNEPFSPQVEAIRGIRSWVMMRVFSAPPATRRALAVVSSNSGDGKSFFAANLAITLAQLGGRTLLVDADLRGPRQHEIFGLPNQAGLSGLLSGRNEKRVVQQVPSVEGLYVLPVGTTPPNPLMYGLQAYLAPGFKYARLADSLTRPTACPDAPARPEGVPYRATNPLALADL